MSDTRRFLDAVAALHREKTAAYGPSWKKRGEQISVMANIARKVDRLEMTLATTTTTTTATATRDESVIDTAVDLFVYALKYLTFLADQDPEVDRALFASASKTDPGPRSNGTAAFEDLLKSTNTSALLEPPFTVEEATQRTIDAYNRLERSFGERSDVSFQQRAALVHRLVEASVDLLGALRESHAPGWRDFVGSWLKIS